MAQIKNINNPNKLNFGGIIKESEELQKAYQEGVYSDTPQNRKLGRVGMSYAAYAAKINGTQKKEEAQVKSKTNAILNHAPLLNSLSESKLNGFIDYLNNEIDGKYKDTKGLLLSKEGDVETKKNAIISYYMDTYKLGNLEFSKRGEFIDNDLSWYLEKSTYTKSSKEGKSNLLTMNSKKEYALNDKLFEELKPIKGFAKRREAAIKFLEKEFGGKYKGNDIIEVNYTLPKEEYAKQKEKLEEALKGNTGFTSFKVKSTSVGLGSDTFTCEANVGDLLVAPVVNKPACEIWVPLYKGSESGVQMTLYCEGNGFRAVDMDNAYEFDLKKLSDLKTQMKKYNYV